MDRDKTLAPERLEGVDADLERQISSIVLRATKHAGPDGISFDELERIHDYVEGLRVQAALLDALLAGRILVRWPDDSTTEQLFVSASALDRENAEPE